MDRRLERRNSDLEQQIFLTAHRILIENVLPYAGQFWEDADIVPLADYIKECSKKLNIDPEELVSRMVSIYRNMWSTKVRTIPLVGQLVRTDREYRNITNILHMLRAAVGPASK